MRDPTLCVTPGQGLEAPFGSLAVPVHRASTVIFPTVAAYQGRRDEIYDGFSYGLYGTPTSRELERRLARLEGAQRTLALPSGFSAIAVTTLAAVSPGQEVLFPDTTYDTVRPFADTFLAGLGIGSRYYDPMLGANIADHLRDETALVWVESPGSMSMEVQDVPAIAAAAHARGAKVAADNTWATPLRFKALAHGVDFSVCALSKYVAGHSDVMMGSVSVADVALYRRLKDYSRFLGLGVSADESSLVLRGLETLAIRMDRAEQSAGRLAAWAAAAGAVLLIGWTLRANRLGNFNIHPRPRMDGKLVTSGPYAWIRHPMYTSFLLGTWALAWTAASDEAWLAWWALLLVLWIKSTLEERWMLAQHPGYAHYREQTKRFIPWVY